ncbi:hypothetical protein B0H12DRAFT_1077148 [Mycena haematopus]|nr:hypothetical protein B0H12DRAFT_1077148 [Mycena haematopus]
MFSLRTLACLVLAAFVSCASAYFVATAPQLNDQWANGQTRLVAWTKGVNDGVTSFDIEMSRLSIDGLSLVAKNGWCIVALALFAPVEVHYSALDAIVPKVNKILLQDVPPGDDYYLLFINSTCGTLYATSPPFSVLPAGASSTNGSTATNSKAATVTVSGAPNPTQTFATTFALVTNGASRQDGVW